MQTVRFDLQWRYWAATAVLLTAGVLGWPVGVAAVIGLTLVQLVHFAWRDRHPGSLTMQVRWLYLAVLLLGLWPALPVLHVLAVVGVWVNVLFGYCPGARLLSLMPWNRRVPLSLKLVAWTFVSPPGAGSILERVPASWTSRATGPAPAPPGVSSRTRTD
jgi:hypothetical protein